MPRQKTGRPVGKPPKYLSKDEQPVTVSLRLPRDLAEQAKRYVKMHRVEKGMTELLLDGLRWRISEGDPRGLGIDLPPELGRTINEAYYGNTDITAPVFEELRTALGRQEKQLQALAQALWEHPAVLAAPPVDAGKTPHAPAGQPSAPVPTGETPRAPGASETLPYNSNTVLHHTMTGDTPAPQPDLPDQAPLPNTKRSKRRAAPTHAAVCPPAPARVSETNMPAFDPTKYILGQLCPRGHDYYGTGQSLRRVHRHVCRECDTEQKRERRQGTRQTPPAASPVTPVPASAQNGTTAQPSGPRKVGRPSTLRQPILDLVRAHPEGLTAIEIKVYLGVDKNIGDTVQGMARDHLLEKQGRGNAIRYRVPGVPPAPSAPPAAPAPARRTTRTAQRA